MRVYFSYLSTVFIVFLSLVSASSAEEPVTASARIIAVGLPGAAAVTQVGTFHTGGPIHDKPEFAAFTLVGKVLDPNRVLVTATSNFGAPRALANETESAALSIDTAGTEVIVIPPDFATHGDQAVALGGKVQLYTAQSPAFINGVNTPKATTAALPPVSNPLGISINNGFGFGFQTHRPAREASVLSRSSTLAGSRSPARRASSPAASLPVIRPTVTRS